jgi:hypothetical protein
MQLTSYVTSMYIVINSDKKVDFNIYVCKGDVIKNGTHLNQLVQENYLQSVNSRRKSKTSL